MMQTTLHILTANDALEGMIDYVLEETNEERTLVFLSEADHYQQYSGYNRNIQVGVSYQDVGVNKLLNYNNVIIESYDYDDMLSFLNQENIISEYLDSYDKNLYIIVPIYVKVKLGSKFSYKMEEIHKKNHNFNQVSVQLIK